MPVKKTVRIKLDDKFYELVTDESEEELISVLNGIQSSYTQLKVQNPEATVDEILLVMLANQMLTHTRYEKTATQLVNKLRDVIERFSKERRKDFEKNRLV